MWWSAEDLGAASTGVNSASPLSYRTFPSSGYVAAFMPFFSADLLPDQTATWQLREAVADHRLNESTPSNGKPPNYFCARTTFNGHHMKQGCNADPAASSFVTRDLFDETVNDLKRGHWIDHRTRLFSITMQMRNNHAGVRFVARYMFEITQMGAVLPSYDMETLIDDDGQQRLAGPLDDDRARADDLVRDARGGRAAAERPARLHEHVERHGLGKLCPLLHLSVTLQRTISRSTNVTSCRGRTSNPCTAQICTQFGYYDLWEVFDTAKTAKFFMSICVCIQLLKIIKFTNVLVPKMSLMTARALQGLRRRPALLRHHLRRLDVRLLR